MASDVPEWEHDDEATLIARLRMHDEAAFGRVYDRFAAAVYGVARRVTGDAFAAEEVVQQVFTYVWQSPAGFDPARGSLRTWMLVIAHRRAVDWVRREVVRRRPLPPEHPLASAEDDAVAAWVADQVRAAVDTLPDQHRQVIQLMYFEQLSVREVAQQLRIPEGTAKTRARTARQRLADRLALAGLAVTH